MPRPNPRKATNLSLDSALLHEARSLRVNLSRAAEQGIRAAVARSREQEWQDQNRAALQSSNDYVARTGLPLAALRRF